MSQAGIINVITNNPTIPIFFDANVGSAVALFNIINIVGAGGITTTGAGNTITITGAAFGQTITGQSGGPLSPTAGNWNIFGASTAAGTSPVTTSGAVSTLTVNVQKSQAIAATNATNVGLAAFNSAHFSVDANGFVSLVAGGPFVTSVSGTANRITSTGGTTPVIDIAATYVGQTSITTLGTIATGVWQGTVIGPTFGGTGLTSYATGDTIYASAANTLSKLTAGSNGQVLTLAAGIPSWATPTTGTVTSVSGTANRITSTGGATPVIDISVAYVGQTSITTLGTVTTGTWNATAIGPTFGGTGQTTYATGDILYASAANTISKLAASTNGFVLTLAAGIPSWVAPSGGTVTSVSGTLNRITSTGGTTPVIDISASYVGQSSITTLGTITTGVWNGTAVDATHGGTAQTTWATGDILYASGVNTLAKLTAGSNTQVLTLAGGVPTWATPTTGTVTSVSGTANRITSTGGATPVIDIAATYVGQTSITTLGTIATGVWQGTVVALAFGGTNANLTASNGGIFYSTATAGAILAGTATANQHLASGASGAPAWTTATYPATTTINQILYSSAANTVTGLATANNGTLITSATGVPSLLANGTTGQVLTATTGSPPSWSAAGTPGQFVLISSQTASNSASIAFNDANYTSYMIVCDSVVPITNAALLQILLSNNSGSSYLATNYIGGVGELTPSAGTGLWAVANSTTAADVTNTIANSAPGAGAVIYLYGMNSGNFASIGGSYNANGNKAGVISACNNGTTAINGFKFQMSTGNISSGVFTLYGIKKT